MRNAVEVVEKIKDLLFFVQVVVKTTNRPFQLVHFFFLFQTT